MNKNIVLYLFCMMLAGCGLLPPANKDPAQNNVVASSASEGGQSAIALPPSYNQRPDGENPAPQLQPLKGPNVDTLFSEKITDTDKRFDRLENAVLSIKREIDDMRPSIARLIAVESDIQGLISQLEILMNEESANAPIPIISDIPPAPLQPPAASIVAASAIPPPRADAPPAPSGGVTVNDLRIGQHSGKIRVVMDVSGDTPYRVDLDNDENLLVVELASAHWGLAAQKSLNSPLLTSYTVEDINNGQGSRVIIYLKKPTEILQNMKLEPGSNKNYRIFMDLKL